MRAALAMAWLALLALPAQVAAVPAATRLSLDDLFAEQGSTDVAVSPSGRYIAVVVRRKDDDLLALIDTNDGKLSGLTKVGLKDVGPGFDARMTSVYWKNEDRILFRVTVSTAAGAHTSLSIQDFHKLGHRLFSVDRSGQKLVRLLAQNRNSELAWAMDLGEIRSMLPRDPDHILMVVDGTDGRSLFKVDVNTGVGEVVEHASPVAWDWWLDLDGKPVVRVEVSSGSLRFYRREDGDRWKKFYKIRLRELKEQDEYQPLGPSDQPGKFYVLARPEGAQRRGIYLYDLEHESFGAPIAENPEFDIFAASVSRDGHTVLHYCYLAHVRICESQDAKLNVHMASVRKYFKDSANVYVVDSSEDNQTLLLFVEGPSDPPSYYWYRLEKHQIQQVGLVHDAMADKLMPTAITVPFTTHDGLKLTGYLTRPPGAENATMLPLIMMPHGGPEARDHLAFDPYVEYFASLGFAVFQPNFRGSDGFGRQFAESGYGEWGHKMQDDINDALALLVQQKIVDPARVCIVGASYGGYAALAGATFTPDLYKCAVSIAGPGDLAEFLKSRRKKFGADSDVYAYWIKQIGDPQRDAARIAAVSPLLHINQIHTPVLLIHGDADGIVPYEQSKEMKKALDRSGRPTRLITLEGEGHSDWSSDNEKMVMTEMGEFIKGHIGPGFGLALEANR
jgi:dipeptidyl aminopeptidase/acylaminoacyl peptidase